MTIAEKIRANQDEQYMTYNCIRILRKLGGHTADLEQEFAEYYGITVDEYAKTL